MVCGSPSHPASPTCTRMRALQPTSSSPCAVCPAGTSRSTQGPLQGMTAGVAEVWPAQDVGFDEGRNHGGLCQSFDLFTVVFRILLLRGGHIEHERCLPSTQRSSQGDIDGAPTKQVCISPTGLKACPRSFPPQGSPLLYPHVTSVSLPETLAIPSTLLHLCFSSQLKPNHLSKGTTKNIVYYIFKYILIYYKIFSSYIAGQCSKTLKRDKTHAWWKRTNKFYSQ